VSFFWGGSGGGGGGLVFLGFVGHFKKILTQTRMKFFGKKGKDTRLKSITDFLSLLPFSS
jgi:hypothetical protein